MQATSQLELDMGVDSLIASYRPRAGVRDELLDDAGRLRPHWQPVLAALAGFGPEETRRRFEVADRHLRHAGVVYRVYGDRAGTERQWPLAPVPLVVTAADWAELSEGVIQRARLLEALTADIYGEGRLVAEGALPAALVAGNSEFLRPLAGVEPKGGRFLSLYSADVSRGPDGRWWVMSDRTQSPSGAGYAIENRIALSRALPELVRDLNVDGLAPFYQAYRAGLGARAGRDDARICLLTPGPLNETYFEHSYLARSLGFLLVEGSDLVVDSDSVHVRTVEGLVRADVILRRLDADFADPLELNARSRLGVPGLVEAVRRGVVVVANALGSGVVEAPALLAFLPGLARRLLGEELALPNVATWWCGEPQARAAVIDRIDRLVLAPSFGRTLPGLIDARGIAGAELAGAERERLLLAMQRRGMDFVGQEPLKLATTPVWDNGRLVPRPFVLRVFVAHGPDGWTVMPGGLCRIADNPDARALTMQRGGRSADIWVIAERPGAPAPPILPAEEIEVRRDTGQLTSRAADNLFWLGRYLQRIDASLRLIRAIVGRSGDASPVAESTEAAARKLTGLLVAWGSAPIDSLELPPSSIAEIALSGPLPGAVPGLIGDAQRAASVIRDRLSPDGWRVIADLAAMIEEPAADHLPEAEVFERADNGLRQIAAFVGLAHETMNRRAGWRFLKLGWRLEWMVAVVRFTRKLADRAAPIECLDSLLDLSDSQTSYRGRYLTGAAHRPVLDLVLLDDANPRSAAFQLERIVEHLTALAKRSPGVERDPAERLALGMQAELAQAEAAAFTPARLDALEAGLLALSDAITARYFTHISAEQIAPADTAEEPWP